MSDFKVRGGVLVKYRGSAKEVEVPIGITCIGYRAFEHNSSLLRVVIPEGVTCIKRSAFMFCDLEKIVLPKGIVRIGSSAFYGCSALTGVDIPDGVTSLEVDVFSGCSSLEEVTIPEGVTSIEQGAFYGCKSLREVAIPQGVERIGGGAFSGCSSLEDVTIPEGVTSIGRGAFSGCKSLREVAIPQGVESIGDYAFEDCESLQKITIPDGLKSMGKGMFIGCEGLRDIVIPDTARNFGKDAFGREIPKGLIPQARKLYHHMTSGDAVYYLVGSAANSIWETLDEDFQFEVTSSHLSKKNAKEFGWRIDENLAERFADRYIVSLAGKPTAKTCSAAAEFMVCFHNKIPDGKLREIYAGIQSAKRSDKAIAAIENCPELMKKLEVAVNYEPLVAENMVAIDPKIKRAVKGVLLSDGQGKCSPEAVQLLITLCAYPRNQAHTVRKRSKGYTLSWTAKKDDVAGEIASWLDADALSDCLEDLFFKKAIPEVLGALGRFGNDKAVVRIVDCIPDWDDWCKGGASGRKDIGIVRGALLLNDSVEAMKYCDSIGLLDQYASFRGTTADEMRDLQLSDFGFGKDAKKNINLGNKAITAIIGDDLNITLFDPETGKTMKSVPKRGTDPEVYEAAKNEFAQLKKDIRKVVKHRKELLFEDFLSGRGRDPEGWSNAYLENPVLQSVARLVVWQQGKNTFTVSGGKIIDSSGAEQALGKAKVKVAHPIDMSIEDVKAWRDYFARNGLKQPFEQVWERAVDGASIKPTRYINYPIPFYWFKGREKHGITVEDFDYHNEINIYLADCDADIDRLDWDRHCLEMNDRFQIREFKFKKYTRRVNHVVAYLDKVCLYPRIASGDMTVMNELDAASLADIIDYINIASDNDATELVAALLAYREEQFPEYGGIESLLLD